MNSSGRFYARLEGSSADKIPNMNLVMGMVAKCAGVSYRDYVQDYRKLVEGNLICAERYGFDSVNVVSDPMREASAFGAIVHFPENGVPYSKPHLLEDGLDLSRVKIVDPLDSPRTLDRIEGVQLLRQKVLLDYPVIGWVEGVLAEVADLRGVNALMFDLMEENETLHELMELVYTQQCRFALEQIRAGADVIGVGNAVASLIGPALYEQHALVYDKKIVQFIQGHGAKVKLHICGNITKLLPLLRQVAPDIIDIDWMVDFREAAKVFSDMNTRVCGNVDPVAVLLQGDKALVEREINACAAVDNAMVAAGCEVPAATPEENLLLMDKLLYL